MSPGHPDGGLVQLGYNYQISQWPIGIEGDYAFADITGTDSTLSALGNTNTSTGKFKWLANLIGRLRYVLTPDLLVYFEGGWAWTHHDASSTLTSAEIVAALLRQADLMFFGISAQAHDLNNII